MVFFGFDNNAFWLVQFCLSYAWSDVDACKTVQQNGYQYLAWVVNKVRGRVGPFALPLDGHEYCAETFAGRLWKTETTATNQAT